MHRLCLVLLLLLLNIQCLLAAPVYDENKRLNLSASCPDSSCRLWGLQSDYQQALHYSGGQVLPLQALLLGNCLMRALPLELFRLTPNLHSLQVLNCSTYHVSREHFQALPQLRQLMLQRNKIARLSGQLFGSLRQLQVLQLDQNIIQLVPAQAFEGLTQLQVLGLQGNGISELMAGAFAPLANLVHLDLSDNEITHMDAKTFERNSKLQTLLLRGNSLAEFEPNSLAALPGLRLLDLSECELHELPELRLLGAQTLRLEGSGVQRLIIDGGVINLLAGNNALTQLSIGDKSAVIELDLHANQLSGNVTSALLLGMWNLQRLDLAKNNIDALTSGSSSSALLLPSLTQLNLAHNQLRSLPPDAALWPPQLTQLDISFNHLLTVTAEGLATLPRLQRLHMEGTRLQEFDHELFHRQHQHLQELGICDTELSFPRMHRVMIYLSDRGVHLPLRCLQRPESGNIDARAVPPTELAALDAVPVQARAGVTGIHPYWTTRDILALLTLMTVFIILLIQLYHILDEEGCLRRMRLWLTGRQPARVNGTRSRRLNEQDSEV
ncbi:insulin-like growth factor-binding protein complex acid labile subunit isoform X2 [Drosophila navojoa]|uniref:insulin-like growth factor-binding protein complex acid labile subunit isoform X2 n=1 Tax=Drosophila navojoa TaxID=7232 RepID=UPI00084653A1|nr:insulin-like growth factor-binding protein complex acid labile subunit isoform X2 [Drosophila navojoa]